MGFPILMQLYRNVKRASEANHLGGLHSPKRSGTWWGGLGRLGASFHGGKERRVEEDELES